MIEIKNGEIKELPSYISPEKQAVLKQIIAEQTPGSLPEKLFCLEQTDIVDMLPKRDEYSHKGTFGKLLLIAGSENMAGAACFAGEAAYRIGCGLVKILTPEANRVILQCNLPEAILSVYHSELDQAALKKDLDWADAVVIGPGLGTGSLQSELVDFVLKNSESPVLFDADALNLLAQGIHSDADLPQDIFKFSSISAVTPHFGEFSRLTGADFKSITSESVKMAREFAETYNTVCHLKHACSITAVPGGTVYINLTGNSGMATAGSGDVLSGIIGGLLAQGMSVEKAVAAGAFIHGDSGNRMAAEYGKHALMASDLIFGLTKLEYLQ